MPEPSISTYMLIKGEFQDRSIWNPSVEFGCGSMITTLEELMDMAHAFFMTTNLLDETTHALMMERVSATGLDHYGRGCNYAEGLGWGHDGTMWGALSTARVDTNNGVRLAAVMSGQYEDERLMGSFLAMRSALGLLKNALGYDAGTVGRHEPVVYPVLGAARQGHPFRFQPLSFNFPTNWAVTGLPDGLTFDPATGEITGATPIRGTHALTVTAQNAYGSVEVELELEVQTGYTNTIAAVSNHIVAAMVEEGTIGVSIALVDDQEIVWAQGFGFADREAGLPVTTDTVFHIGSVSKAFTAALNLQYAERGLLDLDAPFTNYTPDITWMDRYPAARAITVKDLLTHHSGLPGDLIRAGFLTQPLGRGYLETTHDLAQTYPVLEPGTINNYCNVGFVLLEGVAEAAAATEGDPRSFAELANARLFEILDMDATSFKFDKPAISNHLAVPYMGGERMPPEYVEIYGTGSIYSRPVDMAQFMKALFSDTPLVLRPETRDLMIADHSTNAPFDAFEWVKTGLGWDTVSDPRLSYAGPAVWKNGGTLAYSAQFLFLPEKKLGVAIAASSPSGIPMAVDALALQHALLERDGLPIPTNAIAWPTNLAAVSQAELDALAGVYVGSANYDLVESQPGFLSYRRNVPDDGLSLQNLRLRSDGWFRSDDKPDHAISFTNAHGRNLVLHRQNHGFYDTPSILAERFAPPLLPAAWSNRLGRTWIARNAPPDDYIRLLGVAPTLQFIFEDNLLRVNPGGILADRVLEPDSDDLAWIPGLVNRGDSAVQILHLGGVEHVLYAGFVFGPEPADIPLAGTASNTIAAERFADWYAIQPAGPPAPVGGVDDIQYQLTLSDAPNTFLLRVYEADGVTPVAERTGNGTLDFSSGNTPLLLNLQPGSDGPPTGAYQIDFSVPLLVRALAVHSSTVDMVWQGPANTPVTVEAAAHLDATNTFAVRTNLPPDASLLRQQILSPDSASLQFFRLSSP
ncbi:MAG TPA: serine hydrolase [Kiritimatiellia bacterium]|nr:serine hydrolase [Kiritimatiellia bacterium]HRZ13787.1 serine hydrolase [Kiritimatiellia bacterium]HSA19408.1 serine hydrolase [Kiritimatiellia bacterium]